MTPRRRRHRLAWAAGAVLALAWVHVTVLGLDRQSWTPVELAGAVAVEAGLSLCLMLAAARLWTPLGPAAAVCLLALAVARPPPRGPAPTAPRRDGQTLVLVTLDTLRRDHVSAWPGARTHGLTPALDALAAEATRYDAARAPAPLTLPAHASLLSGLPVAGHGAWRNGLPVPELTTWLPRALLEAGLTTAAFTSAAVVGARTGLDQGFTVYRDALGLVDVARRLPLAGTLLSRIRPAAKAPGHRTVHRAVTWLATVPDDRAVFLWVHLYDAHPPYDPARIAPPADLPDPCAWREHPSAWRLSRPMTAEACARVPWDVVLGGLGAYAGGVAATDAAFGELRRGLEALGRWDAATVVVLADHGESLVEHNQHFAHAHALHGPVLDVPLLVRRPGDPPAVVSEPVSTTAVAALLARAAGVAGFDHAGPATSVGPSPGGGLQAAAADGSRTVVVDGPHVERYDRTADPLEQRPVVGAAEREASVARAPTRRPGLAGPGADPADPALHGVPGDVTPWAALEAQARQALERPGGWPSTAVVDPALEALGYVEP